MSARQSYNAAYPAVPESVPEIRAAVSRFAEAAGAEGEPLDALRLAASEAATNAVLHAYADAQTPENGVVHVGASAIEDEVWLFIADEGGGLQPRPQSPGLGLGLALVAQLADDFQILSRGAGGTELRMRFKLRVRDRRGRSQPRGSDATASSAASPSFSTTT